MIMWRERLRFAPKGVWSKRNFMAQLFIQPNGGVESIVPLARLRTTIGRSARSDVCIPDAFASRLHAEVRKEGDSYFLHDLESANGTRYNGSPLTGGIPLHSGGLIQIGETSIRFEDDRPTQSAISATLFAENTDALDPS